MVEFILLAQAKGTLSSSYPHHNRHLLTRPLVIVLLTITALLTIGGLAWSAELFPYSPPSAAQQPSMAQRPGTTPELSSQERRRIEDLSVQAKKLSGAEQQQLKDGLRKNLESAAKAKNWAQVEYYSEALRQIE